MFKLIGKALLFFAMLAFITGVSFFVIGAYVLTWPAMRLSPRGQRQRAVTQLAVSLFALAQSFAPDPLEGEPEKSRPSSPKSAP